jgi:hypothetical protein
MDASRFLININISTFYLDLRPNRKLTTANMAKMKNRIFPISTALAAMPPNPNRAAIKAITKKTTA